MVNKWVVRVVVFSNEDLERITPKLPAPWLEMLRYAGMVKPHEPDGDYQCFDLLPPKGVNSSVWAEQVAGHMETFGYNAVKAPAWQDPKETQELWLKAVANHCDSSQLYDCGSSK